MLQGASGEGAAEEPAAAAKAESGGAGRSLAALWGRVAGPAKEFHEQLASDQAFADHVSRLLDFWTATLSFLVYTIAAILIFVINEALYQNG